ncbi:MAG: uracil-DNA glycosylase [Nitrososphaera sp.]|jgi:uracil-DNA glycosylase family 4
MKLSQSKKQCQFNLLNKKITRCKKCPRLSQYIHQISIKKTKRFLDEKYWGKPLPSFGDINARLLIIGLAPAAHGGNRTGRMFTGDSSGDWLAKVLFNFGFANKPTSHNINDGYRLIDTYITASLHCAPPQNKPLREELENCSVYLKKEISMLSNVKVVICLGKIAFDSCVKILEIKGAKFSHGNLIRHQNKIIISSYHPSKQNTQTGRLQWNQWESVFSQTKKILEDMTQK